MFKGLYSNIDKNQINSKILELNQDFYISFDIHGYKCMPELSKQNNPI